MNLYEKIDIILKEKKMSRRELARQIGVPETTIASAFNRKSQSMSMETIKKIADFFEISADYLLTEERTTTTRGINPNLKKGDIITDPTEMFEGGEEKTFLETVTCVSAEVFFGVSEKEFNRLPEEAKSEIKNYYEYIKQKYTQKEGE